MLSFEDNAHQVGFNRYFLSTIEIKDCNVMTDRKNFSNQPVKNDIRPYDNIRKIAIGQGDDYTTGCLLDYFYFKNYYKMIAITLSKQQALDVESYSMRQISFTANLDRPGNTTMFFVIEKAKQTILDFSQGTDRVL